MSRLLLNLLALLTLLPFMAQAQDGPESPLRGGPGHGGPPGPPAPDGPKQSPLSFEEARSYAARAAVVVRQLQVGGLSLKRTPQGQRLSLSLSLSYLGSPVASVILRPDLSFAERPAVPLLSDVSQLPALSMAGRGTLAGQVGRLAAAGLAQATGPHVRVALLLGGAAVTDLRFDRKTGILLAEPPDGGPAGQRGKPPGPKPPKK
ncbi:hypothetical protein [Deinococcus altitudinis]|uniref:hypothetical protein n=1 Tax=Deinococcus altitudinis TaxID=468914 RepID=UPI00389189E0